MARKRQLNPRTVAPADIELGKRIRIARNEAKISQEELGNQLGVSFQQVQKYEKGTNRVGAARLQQIADAFGKPVSFFYTKTNAADDEVTSLMFRDPKYSIRLLQAYAKLDRTVQRLFVEMMEAWATASPFAR